MKEGGKEGRRAMLSSIVYLTASQREERRKRGEKEGRREGGREGTFSLLYLNLKVFDNTLSPVRVRPPSLPPSLLPVYGLATAHLV